MYLSELSQICSTQNGVCSACTVRGVCSKIALNKPLNWNIEPRLTAYDTPDQIRQKLGEVNYENF